MPTYRIALMCIEDIEEVLAIENRSFPTPWTRGMFFHELANPVSHLFVIKIGEEEPDIDFLSGYICFWEVYDEIHILNLAVHPDLRRQGIATMLLTFALNHGSLKHMQKAILEVREHNHPAQRLYHRIGFRYTGVRKEYYRDTGEDALLLELDLHAYKRRPLPFEADMAHK